MEDHGFALASVHSGPTYLYSAKLCSDHQVVVVVAVVALAVVKVASIADLRLVVAAVRFWAYFVVVQEDWVLIEAVVVAAAAAASHYPVWVLHSYSYSDSALQDSIGLESVLSERQE